MNNKINVLGLMSGSSCDGVDAAICSFWMVEDRLNYELVDQISFRFSDELKEGLKVAASKSQLELYSLDTQFSKFLSASISTFLTNTEKVDYIASHGHTVLHAPAGGYTIQLGNGALISQGTGIPTICDFRSQDIACGGQGAPLAPLADEYLFGGHDFYLNLGGIVNISHVRDQHVLGYDIAPCNQMLNALSNLEGLDYDDDGKMASDGKLNEDLLRTLLDNNYLSKNYPKSLDNSWVRDNYTQPLLTYEDTIKNRLRTAVEFIAIAIKNDLTNISLSEEFSLLDKTIFCTGGGVFNKFMMERISFHCGSQGVKVFLPEPNIIEYKEAILMALMGYLRVGNKPNCIASVTGASKDCSAGVIYHP